MEEKEIGRVVFENEQQERIHRRLGLIGEGAQAFYRDASRMMARPTKESTSHLVGHLFREIESSVRKVLEPLLQARTATGKKTGKANEDHKVSIRAVLCVLEIPESDHVAALWLSLADDNSDYRLHAAAHRDNLMAPRPVTEKVRQEWRKVETLLDHILEKFEEHYLKTHDYIDSLLNSGKDRNWTIEEFSQHCPHNQVTLGYFFGRLDSADYIDPLVAKGYLKNPPPPQEVENSITLPFWPESQYLARVAAQAPDKVLEVILAMEETSNSRVHSDLLDALCAIPAVTAAKAKDRVVPWIESTSYLWFPDSFARLIVHMAEEGETSAALHIARSLLALHQASNGVSDEETEDAFPVRREPVARYGNWEYREAIKKIVRPLTAAAGMDALALFCDLLDEAATFCLRPTLDGGQSLLFFDWPTAIEEHEQNQHRDSPKDTLLFAVRDTAELLMDTKGKEVLDFMRARKCVLFQRIEMHLRGRWPELDVNGTANLLSNPAIFESVDLRHELYHLLRAVFGRISSSAQNVYYDHIEHGFPEDWYVRWRTEEDKKTPEKDNVERARRCWQYKKLLPIEPYLTSDWRARFEALREEFPEPEHPDFPIYMGPVEFVEHKSPKGRDELASMSNHDLVTYLREFEPTDSPFFESFAGLRTEIEVLVFSDPGRYAAEAERLSGLRPTFVRAILEGIRRSVKEGQGLQPDCWPSVLGLCAWVVRQAQDAPTGEEKYGLRGTAWRSLRRTITDLLGGAFDRQTNSIPWTLRESAWAVLLPLTDDSDPSPDRELDRAGFEPAMLAVNAVRSMAIRMVIQYALWVRRHTEKRNAGEETGAPKGFDVMPEVREVLDRHLDPKQDASLAVRSVYGEYFPLLACLDEDWGREHLTFVFPREPEYLALREVAWTSCVTFIRGGSRPDVFEMLEVDYLWAINKIGSWTNVSLRMANPDEKLAEHLAVFYWYGEIELGDAATVLGAFYAKAPALLRGHIIHFLGEQLQDKTLVLEPEVRSRLENLWLSRIENVRASQDRTADAKELEGFGLWFANRKFDDAWAMQQLKDAVALAGTLDLDHFVMMKLAEAADRFPLDAVECVRYMVEAAARTGPAWTFLRWEKSAKKILWSAVKSEKPEAKKAAKALANKLGALGQTGYRDIAQS